MDSARAEFLANQLKGPKVGDWNILNRINHGKSAVVMTAERDGKSAAIKVFDRELIERHGIINQLVRINREKELIGLNHPNLIEILDGGECEASGNIYVVMSYLPWDNLSQVITDVPREKIGTIIQQVAAAAKFLEDIGMAHRDIKPQNIAISDDFETAVLLDLGVLRPVGISEITDATDQKVFIATLRYSPPELLYRTKEDTTDGWRAITFYQLGAVLHDLIMKEPIFKQFSEPYASLVDAVREQTPAIKADDVDQDLILLAKSCLIKKPADRLSMVDWNHFLSSPKKSESADAIKKRIKKRQKLASNLGDNKNTNGNAHERYKKSVRLDTLVFQVKDILRSICIGDSCFPRSEITHSILDPDKYAKISFCFNASSDHALFCNGTLVLFLSLDIMPDEIIKVEYFAVASKDAFRDDLYKTPSLIQLYLEPYNRGSIQEKINLLLLAFIDECQTCEQIDSEDPKTLAISM